MKKLLMVIFTENFSIGASMLSSLAREHEWEADIHFVPPGNENNPKIEIFLKQHKPDLIGISFKSWERHQAVSLAETIKGVVDTKIIAGGIHPTLMPDEIIQTGFFDAIVVGDGMGVFEKILDEYMNLDGEVVTGKQHPNLNLYNKHFFSKSQVKRMKATETASVLTAIGCPHKCTFCHSGSENFLAYPVESVMAHILELYYKYGVRSFHFLDDLFASNPKRLQRFRKAIEETDSDIAFSSQVTGRASSFNERIAAELVEMGVETINFGIETASPKLLKFLNKNQTIEDCYRAVRLSHEFGLNCVINLMFGIPTQDEDDYECTLEYVEKAKPDSANCFFYAPYPGTKLYDYCFDNHFISESFDRNKFDWFRPDIGGTPEIQLKLDKVDYDLGLQYINKINQALSPDEYLFERMKIVDSRPWVLVGTTRHYYYITMIKKLSHFTWKNCLGYINTDTQAGFFLDREGDIFPKYEEKTNVLPFWCVTYSFLGSDYQQFGRYVKDRFGSDIPLISISSFKKSHGAEDIKIILNDRI